MENIHKASEQPMPMLVNPVTGTTIGVAYNQQNIGTTIRPASTALLTIDSEDRFTDYVDKRASSYPKYNWNPYDFTITKNESLMNGFFTRLAVTEVVFPTTGIPNINNQRSQIQVTYKPSAGVATTVTVTVPTGFYTPDNLAIKLQALIRAINVSLSAFVMDYGLNTAGNPEPQFYYDTTNATQISFAPMTYNTPAYPYPTTTRQLFDLLGFGNANTVLNTVGFSGITNCEGTRYVDIVCPQLSYNQPLKDTSSQEIVRDALCRIYIVPNSYDNLYEANDSNYAPPGTLPTVIYRNFAQPKQIAWVPNQPIGQLTFQVYDDNGALLRPVVGNDSENQNNIEWSMSILVSEN